jgi:hypothetical protein
MEDAAGPAAMDALEEGDAMASGRGALRREGVRWGADSGGPTEIAA